MGQYLSCAVQTVVVNDDWQTEEIFAFWKDYPLQIHLSNLYQWQMRYDAVIAPYIDGPYIISDLADIEIIFLTPRPMYQSEPEVQRLLTTMALLTVSLMTCRAVWWLH